MSVSRPASKVVKALVLQALIEGPLSSGGLVARTGRPERDVRRARLELVAEGKVISSGEGKATVYSLVPGVTPGSDPGEAPGVSPGSNGPRGRAHFLGKSQNVNEEVGGGCGGVAAAESPRGECRCATDHASVVDRLAAVVERLAILVEAVVSQLGRQVEGRVSPDKVPARAAKDPGEKHPGVLDVTPKNDDERRALAERLRQLAPVQNVPLMTARLIEEFRANPAVLRLRCEQADEHEAAQKEEAARVERAAAAGRSKADKLEAARVRALDEFAPKKSGNAVADRVALQKANEW